ncbi:hypothetical protein J6590_048598 [Homalodisca vitripennis]|nr:hypothetical protein J6590_048598 [Homalodisca vitripennis]
MIHDILSNRSAVCRLSKKYGLKYRREKEVEEAVEEVVRTICSLRWGPPRSNLLGKTDGTSPAPRGTHVRPADRARGPPSSPDLRTPFVPTTMLPATFHHRVFTSRSIPCGGEVLCMVEAQG